MELREAQAKLGLEPQEPRVLLETLGVQGPLASALKEPQDQAVLLEEPLVQELMRFSF
jgi:hypothetical protein